MPEPTKVIGNKQTDNYLSNNFLWLQCIILPKFLAECCSNTQKPMKNSPWHKSTGNGNYFSYHFVVKTKWSMNSQLDQTFSPQKNWKIICALAICFLVWVDYENTFTNLCLFKTNDWCMQMESLINSEKTFMVFVLRPAMSILGRNIRQSSMGCVYIGLWPSDPCLLRKTCWKFGH